MRLGESEDKDSCPRQHPCPWWDREALFSLSSFSPVSGQEQRLAGEDVVLLLNLLAELTRVSCLSGLHGICDKGVWEISAKPFLPMTPYLEI